MFCLISLSGFVHISCIYLHGFNDALHGILSYLCVHTAHLRVITLRSQLFVLGASTEPTGKNLRPFPATGWLIHGCRRLRGMFLHPGAELSCPELHAYGDQRSQFGITSTTNRLFKMRFCAPVLMAMRNRSTQDFAPRCSRKRQKFAVVCCSQQANTLISSRELFSALGLACHTSPLLLSPQLLEVVYRHVLVSDPHPVLIKGQPKAKV
ncbi:hypothetical protein BDN72DRAFT_307809 [Pluteus cervinus]|uniref:Uncharacterized protein n=1 Tax=Pluteus cervinus TaxID=181527 RepID=A0ACD3ADL3_9AGAR|nr:hypothetical protein BDN72DRAFT_307809 [Pluteus cervinus]